ncbi:MAG: TonB-dependent receptor [Bacteroidota bacterium]|nr:TonB-dependent receptor [Bacteroidota bacterium]
MRIAILLFFTCLCSMRGLAQKNTSSIKGSVTDSLSQKGLAYATLSVVRVNDSTLVSFARADSDGKFSISGLSRGQYLLSASYVGYLPVWKSIAVTKEGESIHIGNIEMKDLLSAGDVTVTARRAPVTINNDTIEFNTENFKTQPNAVVEDLLKKLPGVTVDNDGTVRVNGQRVNRVLVNGKDFFTGDPKMATRNLDADAIDKVQVFDKKSDRAEFTGVDDGQSEKSINLKLKKDRNHALFGKITAGGGTRDRYDAQTNINKFNGDQQFSLIGMGNNTNRQGFSISDILNFTGELARGMRSGGGITIRTGGDGDNGLPVSDLGQNQQGVATTFAGGVNYNDNWNKKTDVNMSAMGTNIDLRTDKSLFRQNLLPGNEFDYLSNNSTDKKTKQQKLNMSIDSKIDSTTSLKFTPQFAIQQTDSRSTADYNSKDGKGVTLNDGTTASKTHSDAFNFNGNALFRKRLAKKGRTLSSTISLAYNDSKQNGDLYTRNTFYNAGSPLADSVTNQQNRREAVTRSFGGNLVYTEPIGKRSLLEFSGYYNTNVGNSKQTTYDYGTQSGKYDQLNLRQSNDFKSEYTYAGGSLNFRSNLKKLNLTLGTSLQQANLYSTNNTNGNLIKQGFTDFLPNAMLQYRFSSARNLNLNYSTSTTQPNTNQLQPVTDVSDPLNVYTGNPNLKRSYMQSLSLNYFSTNMFNQHNFFAFLSASRTDNAIVNSDLLQPNGARVTTPVNVSGNYAIFGSVNAGFPLKKIKSRIDLGLGTNIMHNAGFINGVENGIDNISISPNLNYGFSLDGKLDINLTGRVSFSKASYSLQPQLNSNYLQQSYGWDMSNYLPGHLVLNNKFTYTLNSGRADGYNTSVPMWNASVAKSFLKNQRAELKLSVFDLLNQNIGISRNASQNYIEDTRYNVLQRYFLLSFTFRLNKAGSNANGPRIVVRTIGD